MKNPLVAIDIQDLHFRWHKHAELTLKIPALTIHRGEKVFIQGASGSGKTTLLSLIGGVLLSESGQLCVLNQEIHALRAAQRDAFRAEHIGFIFQMFNLLPYLSVLDNVLLPCRFSARRKQKALSNSSSLENEAIRLLEHLDIESSQWHAPITSLSVGQQQRVAAARALIGSPELVIADEPTSALDADRRDRFLQLLQNECAQQDSTLIFVSHDNALQAYFDRHIHLADINHAVKAG